jgi:hypothetical protein
MSFLETVHGPEFYLKHNILETRFCLRLQMASGQSWPAQIIGAWVRIPLEAWVFICIYARFVLFCV